MKKILDRIWLEIKRFWWSTWYVWFAVVLAIIAGLIFGWNVSVWVFFGGVGAFIAFIFLRQIWWFISGTGDYEGRNGLLKRLWNWIFKK